MTVGMGVRIMRIDLEFDQSGGDERRRFDDRHVVRGADCRTGHVAAGAPSDIGHTVEGPFADCLHEALLLHGPDQRERVTAADDDRFGRTHGAGRVAFAVYGTHLDAQFRKSCLYFALVVVVRERNGGVRDEQHFPDRAQELPDLSDRIFEKPFAGVGRITDKQ